MKPPQRRNQNRIRKRKSRRENPMRNNGSAINKSQSDYRESDANGIGLFLGSETRSLFQ